MAVTTLGVPVEMESDLVEGEIGRPGLVAPARRRQGVGGLPLGQKTIVLDVAFGRAVLAEQNLEVPQGREVEVVLGAEVRVDDTDTVRRFILPASPSHELIEEELVGDVVAYCYCGACGRCGRCGCRCRC